jgi:hypothetical protein
MRRLVVLLVLLALVAVLSASANASTPAKVSWLALPAGSVVTGDDGANRLVYAPTGGVRAIFDVATGTSTPMPLPPAKHCTIQLSGVVQAAQCFTDQGVESWYLGSFDGSEWTLVTVPPLTDNADEHWIAGAGSAWFQVISNGYKWSHYEVQYVSRADGHVLPDDQVPAGGLDLDQPTPQAPGAALCPTLVRADLRQIGDPWSLYLTLRHTKPTRFTLSTRRCGSSRHTVLTQHANPLFPMAVRRNVVVWSVGKTGYVRNLRTGRTRTIRVKGYRVSLGFVGARVLVSATLPNQAPARVGFARLTR